MGALCPAVDVASAGHESNVRIADVPDSELSTRASELLGVFAGDDSKVDLALSRHNSLSERPAGYVPSKMKSSGPAGSFVLEDHNSKFGSAPRRSPSGLEA